MRRKNMNGVDTDLNTTGDAYQGVDLNRNFDVGWGNAGSSPTSESYYGTAPASESETQAVKNAVTLFESPAQLRYYADVHGAIPAIYSVFTGAAALDAQTSSLTAAMQRAYRARNGVAGSYFLIPVNPGDEIGATDEYHGVTYGIPSMTLEYPTPRYRVGGWGPTFILPEDEVAQTVDENEFAILLAMIWAAGPPVLESVVVWRDLDSDDERDPGELLHHSEWVVGGDNTTRTRSVLVDQPLTPDAAYRVELQFNKPMRWEAGAGPALWPGQTGSLHPAAQVTVETALRAPQALSATPVGEGWLGAPATATVPGYRRYQYDTWMGTLDATALGELTVQSAALRVTASDLAGLALDAQPSTVADFDEGWVGHENASGAGSLGGTDETALLQFAPVNRVEGWQLY
jgi:hypothetical protein